jgi:hypothetical protein
MAKKKLGKLKSRFDKKGKSKSTAIERVPKKSLVAKLSETEAAKLQKTIIAHFNSADQNLIAAAVGLKEFKEGKGWEALGYSTMSEWREKEMQFGKFYSLTNVMKLLDAGVSQERIEKMPLTNVDTLTRKLPESKWTDDSILTLAEGPIKEFDKVASKKSEEIGMHVEDLERRGFKVSKSVADNWDLALRIAETVDGCTVFEKRIEAIVSNYINAESEIEGKSKLQVYEDSLQKAKKKSA